MTDTPDNPTDQWVDNDEKFYPGDRGFVILQAPEGKEPRTIIRAKPGRDSETNARVLHGQLGRGAQALGVAEVVKINRKGDRARVAILAGHDARAALEDLGHPEMAAALAREAP